MKINKCRRKTPLLLAGSMLLLSYFFANIAVAESQFHKKKMNKYLSLLSENNVAMLSIEIVEKGKSTYQNQTGFAYLDDNRTKIKANVDTQYRIGSITKMFTATLIMQLIEQDKLSLTTTLSQFYPEIKNSNKINIDHMLSHRSGLYDYVNEDPSFAKYFTKLQSKEEMISRIVNFEPVFEPAEKSSYSNTNYLLLGYIIEKITGESYQIAVQKNIINKLNLKSTHLNPVIDIGTNQAQSFYFSNNGWQLAEQWHLSAAGAAGNITSNPKDLNIFMNALIDGELVSKKSLKNMFKSHKKYGKGINRFLLFGLRWYGHIGTISGFQSFLMYNRDDEVSIAITMNGIGMNNFVLLENILSIYYDKPFIVPSFKH